MGCGQKQPFAQLPLKEETLKKILALLFILLKFSAALPAQNIDSVLNDLLFEDEELLSLFERAKKCQFLYTSVNYRNQTYFAGRDIGIDQFNMTSQISYIHFSGITAGLAGIFYSEFEPKLNTTIASLGYGKSFNKLRLRASFDKYFFAQIDSLEESSFNSSLTLGTSYRLKYLRSSFNFSFLLGSEPSTQASWRLTGYIKLWNKGYQKKLRFEPGISLLFGNESVLSTASQSIRRGFIDNIIETETSVEKYGLINTQFRLPLNLTYGNFDFEIGYNYNLPRTLDNEASPLSNTSFFNISIGYLLDC